MSKLSLWPFAPKAMSSARSVIIATGGERNKLEIPAKNSKDAAFPVALRATAIFSQMGKWRLSEGVTLRSTRVSI